MKSKLVGLGLGAAMLLSLSAMGAGTAFAASSVDSPNQVQADTTQLNWTGQGTTSGALNDELCGDNADPGAGGFQNGATATDYILWIFTTDGGSVTADPTITINGTTYGSAYQPGAGTYQIVTPSYDLASITDAHTNFTVADTGSGAWVLTISHGCIATHEDQQINATGHIGGPCADPSYFGVFDNTQSNVSIKFKFSWYTTTGYHVVTRLVPGGMGYTTWIHWAKPGTKVRVGWKDPNTGAWTYVDTLIAVRGSYPACTPQDGYDPGFWQPTA